VPVWMGSSNVDPNWIPGPNSVVKVWDFKGPKELAQYLTRMCEDDDEYAKFFEWKKQGISKHFLQRLNDCVFYGSECRLCQHVLEQRTKLSPPQSLELNKRHTSHHIYAALLLSGNEYMSVPPSVLIDLGKQFTISLWMKAKDMHQPIMERGEVFGLHLTKLGKRSFIELRVKHEKYLGDHPVEEDRWHHFVVVFNYDDATVRFWSNGWEDHAIGIPLTYATPGDYVTDPPLVIGADYRKQTFFRGELDEIAIWNQAVTRDRARRLVYEMPSQLEPGLVANWSFNHMKGKYAQDSSLTQLDASVHGDFGWTDARAKSLVTTKPCL